MSIESDPTQIFIRNWEIYQKTILANYMKHEEIGLLSQKHIKEFASNQRIKILDLGCGDAHQIANQLATLNIQSYTGYDLSNQAIDLAKQHLQKTNAKLEFQVGKMEDLIKTESNTYNLLYSSFAVHHLNDEDKKVKIGVSIDPNLPQYFKDNSINLSSLVNKLLKDYIKNGNKDLY